MRLDYCWGGLVDMTQDRLPHAGERDGLFYSMGYSGHGTQMSVLMGERMAAVMAGDASANPWRGRDVARDSRPLRAAVVPARGRPVLPPEGSPRLRAPSTFFHDRHQERDTMTDRKQFDTLVGPEESQRLMGALQRGATRRDMLAMLMAGGMQATLAGSLAAWPPRACANAAQGRPHPRRRPTRGVNDTLDPAKQSNQTDYCRGYMFYNGLTSLDGSLTPQPALAEEFTTKDAKTWVFKLRKGVTFHDGKPLTPADVVFSIMRHKDPATASQGQGAGRPDREREGHRPQRSDVPADARPTPTCR